MTDIPLIRRTRHDTVFVVHIQKLFSLLSHTFAELVAQLLIHPQVSKGRTSSISTPHPMANAPASKHLRTRSPRALTPFSVGLQTVYLVLTLSGMALFVTVGASKIAPWIRSDGLICCRRSETLFYAATTASRALTPSHGLAPAWALVPLHVHVRSKQATERWPATPVTPRSRRVRSDVGCLASEIRKPKEEMDEEEAYTIKETST